ncbi:Neutral endopeptidase [Mycoplasmopsis arginini]|nr:hypothetical protein RBEMOGI_1699 [Rickettsia bellii str. RML Mogi]CRH46134.1 Neutral endopeptidase [Chlamydia trachomatis]SGA02760.1 Neutral endopeptidase [Chlamydia abortus]SGA18239.1 Neutral endopeptidase [Mycoplasmopsis arginini]CRH48871.1 Neutral endopeptidase [Chlamydia trachomatis]
MVFGKYYGEEYFGRINKENVKKMIYKMIKIYENRLSQND